MSRALALVRPLRGLWHAPEEVRHDGRYALDCISGAVPKGYPALRSDDDDDDDDTAIAVAGPHVWDGEGSHVCDVCRGAFRTSSLLCLLA